MSEYGELWKTQTYRLILPNEFYGSCGLKKPICKQSHFLDDKTLEKKQNIVNGSSYCRKAQVFGAETEVSKRVFS